MWVSAWCLIATPEDLGLRRVCFPPILVRTARPEAFAKFCPTGLSASGLSGRNCHDFSKICRVLSRTTSREDGEKPRFESLMGFRGLGTKSLRCEHRPNLPFVWATSLHSSSKDQAVTDRRHARPLMPHRRPRRLCRGLRAHHDDGDRASPGRTGWRCRGCGRAAPALEAGRGELVPVSSLVCGVCIVHEAPSRAGRLRARVRLHGALSTALTCARARAARASLAMLPSSPSSITVDAQATPTWNTRASPRRKRTIRCHTMARMRCSSS